MVGRAPNQAGPCSTAVADTGVVTPPSKTVMFYATLLGSPMLSEMPGTGNLPTTAEDIELSNFNHRHQFLVSRPI